MATNLEIDNKLIQEALKLVGHRTKRAVVEAALYINSFDKIIKKHSRGRETADKVN